DEQLLKILIEYCIKCAKKHHPAYLLPVEQCLAQLSKDYPGIVAKVFISTSYIPAHNHKYVASHAICTSNKIHGFFGDNKNPVFILRSQLPTTTSTTPPSYFFWKTNRDLRNGLESRFPKPEAQPPHKKPKCKIFVSPFQFRPIDPLAIESQTTDTKNLPKGLRKIFIDIAANIRKAKTKLIQKEPRKESVFVHIAKKDHFDNPAIVAIIRFKWYTFVIKYWLRRFVVVLIFFIFMMVITAKQIAVSSREPGENPSEDEIAARYLPGSPFNLVSLAAFISSVIGCFNALEAEPGIKKDTGIDGGPSQIWILTFSILLLYLNM
ncbi:hypothetical protein BGZ65_011754, partial [Modicella reniformis]